MLFRSVVDADLRVFGDGTTQWMTGDIAVRQAAWTRRYDVASELLAAGPAVSTESTREGHIRFDVKLRVPGTFTVDNTGWLGTNMVMPIINVPEVGIVTMDRITKRPVVVETPEGDVIAIRSIMNMVLAVDHRANDGAQASAFLRVVKAALEAVGPDTPVY